MNKKCCGCGNREIYESIEEELEATVEKTVNITPKNMQSGTKKEEATEILGNSPNIKKAVIALNDKWLDSLEETDYEPSEKHKEFMAKHFGMEYPK